MPLSLQGQDAQYNPPFRGPVLKQDSFPLTRPTHSEPTLPQNKPLLVQNRTLIAMPFPFHRKLMRKLHQLIKHLKQNKKKNNLNIKSTKTSCQV